MIKVEGVRKSFRGNEVLRGVDLEIAKAESCVIIGKSGSGKSVLLRLVIGLMKPDAGRIWVDGLEVNALGRKELAKLRIRFGMLFQGSALFDSMTVGENIGLTLREHTRKTEPEIRAIVAERLELVGLAGTEDLKPAALSGGMRKRVGLARALALDPEIMLYDEPTTGLDPVTGDKINDLIVELREKLKVTSITVTHDMRSAMKIGHTIAMISNGKIIFRGTPQEARETEEPHVRSFVDTGTEIDLDV